MDYEMSRFSCFLFISKEFRTARKSINVPIIDLSVLNVRAIRNNFHIMAPHSAFETSIENQNGNNHDLEHMKIN